MWVQLAFCFGQGRGGYEALSVAWCSCEWVGMLISSMNTYHVLNVTVVSKYLLLERIRTTDVDVAEC